VAEKGAGGTKKGGKGFTGRKLDGREGGSERAKGNWGKKSCMSERDREGEGSQGEGCKKLKKSERIYQ